MVASGPLKTSGSLRISHTLPCTATFNYSMLVLPNLAVEGFTWSVVHLRRWLGDWNYRNWFFPFIKVQAEYLISLRNFKYVCMCNFIFKGLPYKQHF